MRRETTVLFTYQKQNSTDEKINNSRLQFFQKMIYWKKLLVGNVL